MKMVLVYVFIIFVYLFIHFLFYDLEDTAVLKIRVRN